MEIFCKSNEIRQLFSKKKSIINAWQVSKYIFTIQFLKVLWSLKKTTEVKYGLIEACFMNTHWKEKKLFWRLGWDIFFHLLVWKQDYYFFWPNENWLLNLNLTQ